MNARAVGMKPKKAIVNLDELTEFCVKQGKKNNAETKAHFIAELSRHGKAEKLTS